MITDVLSSFIKFSLEFYPFFSRAIPENKKDFPPTSSKIEYAVQTSITCRIVLEELKDSSVSLVLFL